MQGVSITDDLFVGPPPINEEGVRALSRDRFRSLLNLQPPEQTSGFSSQEEGVCAEQLGLMYLNYPVSADDLDEFHVDALRTKLQLLPKPVFIHARNWQRAAVLGLIELAVSEHWSGEEALQHAAELDVDCNDPAMRQLVMDYVESRTKAEGEG